MIPNSPIITIPLQTDENGAIRVGNSRVLLELIIHAYYMGETPEGIVDSYPSLTIADVYAVIGYYLNNRDDIDMYMRQRDQLVAETLHEMETTMTPQTRALRTRLRAHQQHRNTRQ